MSVTSQGLRVQQQLLSQLKLTFSDQGGHLLMRCVMWGKGGQASNVCCKGVKSSKSCGDFLVSFVIFQRFSWPEVIISNKVHGTRGFFKGSVFQEIISFKEKGTRYLFKGMVFQEMILVLNKIQQKEFLHFTAAFVQLFCVKEKAKLFVIIIPRT